MLAEEWCLRSRSGLALWQPTGSLPVGVGGRAAQRGFEIEGRGRIEPRGEGRAGRAGEFDVVEGPNGAMFH